MKWLSALICAACLWEATVLAQSPVTLTLEGPAYRNAIPEDFSGLSFETLLEIPGTNRQYIFSGTNQPLITLFQTLGIHSLRLGGNTADMPSFPIPGFADIDNLFAFARAVPVKVIYTLRMRNGNLATNAAIARYIKDHYQAQLTCFAIGNEPDYYRKVYPVIKDYPAYRDAWKKDAAAIPDTLFCAPCTGGSPIWTREFADDFAKSPLLTLITQHDYPGGSSRRVASAAAARDQMLSPAWLAHYDKFYHAFATTAQPNGLAYRLEEASNYSEGGVKNASDTFSAALWSLDYLHWWAAHGAGGINFHGRRWVPNCVIHPVPALEVDGSTNWSRNYNIRPIGYGIKAFDLGGHGHVQPLTLSNPDAINLTAYAVREGSNIVVTILNKSHGRAAREANVTILGNGISKDASLMLLTAPNGGVSAQSGVTLGGASIEDDGSWHGQWTALHSTQPGTCAVKVPPASAAIVKISAFSF
ncbi:MAG TPA: glycosyl hydrolase family 79 C-terminal domain-containing protein [Candidatus Saccharimonadales bacterium]|nr:glycosyl hydrolase family 79 C-terminal domain-containing protein [Candidatus Saccharimonadales bacterium]